VRNAGEDLATAIKAHQQYLGAHPRGQHVTASQDHIDFLRSRLTEQNGANDPSVPLKSFEQYLASHPHGQYIEEARDGAEFWKAVYTASRATDDGATAMKAYEQYFVAHPSGRYTKEARDRIELCDKVKPLGFFVAENVPGPQSFDGRFGKWRHLPLTLTDKTKRFLVVVVAIRSDQFMPSEAEYRHLELILEPVFVST